MAGDWIKLQHWTTDKPEIYGIAAHLGISHGDAFLACVRLWIWADQQSFDGSGLVKNSTENVSRFCHADVTLESVTRCKNIVGALQKVGWLRVESDGSFTLPHFDRHNGETAKTRAQSSDRKKKQREKDDVIMSRSDRDKSVTREEKSIRNSSNEELLIALGVTSEVAKDFIAHRKAKKAPVTKTALTRITNEATKAGISLEDALREMCARGWQGFKAEWIKEKKTYSDVRQETYEGLTGRTRLSKGFEDEPAIPGQFIRLAS